MDLYMFISELAEACSDYRKPGSTSLRIVTLALEHVGECYDRNRAHYVNQLDNMRLGSYRWKREIERMSIGSRRPWVAEITQISSAGGIERTFLDGLKDYTKTDSSGSRGIYFYYHLYPGRLYEVCHYLDWKREDRYFCKVVDGKIVRIPARDIHTELILLHAKARTRH